MCDGPCNPAIEVLFTVEVDDDGVGYANVGGEEIVPSGPSAIAVDHDGRVWIVDQVNRRLLVYSQSGSQVAVIDLTEYEVASAFDLAAGRDRLLLLDLYVAMDRYRLLELDYNGDLVAVHDLPRGVRLEDGLTGVAAGPQGEVWLELELGAQIASLEVSNGSVDVSITPGYDFPSGRYRPVDGAPFAFQAGEVTINVVSDAELGGISLLGVNADESIVVVLDEVTIDHAGVLHVEKTVHLFDAAGLHLGSANFPLAEQFLEVEHPMTVGPDGNTYALLTRPDHIVVVRLSYSR